MDRVSSRAGRRIGRCRSVDIRLSEVISALSHALDVTEGQPMGHAVRSCAIGMRIGEEIGLDDDARSSLFYALLLKDPRARQRLEGSRRHRRRAPRALDGRGYHLGLRDEHLNRDARILAVADVCEALTADRPYREAMEPDHDHA